MATDAVAGLEGRVAVVTGAGRGLGLAMARGLAAAGVRVAATDIDGEALAAADDSVLAIAGDVSRPADALRACEETMARFGGLDILVNNAGLGPQRFRDTDRTSYKPVWEIGLEDWHLFLDANVTGHFVMTRTVMPHLLAQGWGRIVGVTTSFETMTNPANGAYGPSKAAAEALAAMTAGALAGASVTCNVLIPGGPADTRMITATGVYADRGGLIRPEAMVPPLLHLVSDAGASVNGRRVRAALWDPARTASENMEKASAPVAWPQLGGQAVHPDGGPAARRGAPG